MAEAAVILAVLGAVVFYAYMKKVKRDKSQEGGGFINPTSPVDDDKIEP